MNEPASTNEAAGSRLQATAQSASQATLDVVEVLKRQFWLIACCAAFGMLLSVVYWANAREWYETRARMLVTLKDPKLAEPGQASYGNDFVQDNALANSIEIVRSREIVGKALARGNYDQLPSIQEQLDPQIDAIQYVAASLSITKGGEGIARDARTLNIAFRHTDPVDSLNILEAIVSEYEIFLDAEVKHVMSATNDLVNVALKQVEQELNDLENQYLELRANAPLIYQGENGSSMYMDKLRGINNELASTELKYLAVEARLNNFTEKMAQLDAVGGSNLEKLSLIDVESLQRLTSFAGLQNNAANSADFLATQPLRYQEAQTQMQTLQDLNFKKLQLESSFGPGHPELATIQRKIDAAQQFLEESKKQTLVDLAFDRLSPHLLLEAYVAFLKQDLLTYGALLREYKRQFDNAEEEAKLLVAFEMQEQKLKSEIERKRLVFDGIMEQLRNLNTISGLTGYSHHVLERPRPGERVWPDLKICLLAGSMLGLVLGMLMGVFSDQIDKRFRTPAEIDAATGVPVIGQVGRIRKARGSRRVGRMIVDAQAPEAESFRLLRTYLLRDVKSGAMRLISATSCQTKDGKSTILCNLAASFAELGIRTVIVDGDMRAPTTHGFFDVAVNGGLSELLQGKIELADAIKPSGLEALSLITAGAAVRNPAELLDSQQFDGLLEELKEQFDLIVIDSGPVLWVSDPAIVAQRADATLMIIRSSTDTKRKVQESIRRLRAANAKLRGCIINTYGSTKEFTQDTGYSSPYHYYYYGGYGRRVAESGTEKEHGAHPQPYGAHSHQTARKQRSRRTDS